MKIPTGNLGGAEAKQDLSIIHQPSVSGASLSRLGHTGQVFARQQINKDNQLLVTDALNQLDAYQAKLTNDPDVGLYAQKGMAALGATARYRTDYDEMATRLIDKMPEAVKADFTNQVNSRRIQFTRSGLQYETQQKDIATAAADKASMDNSVHNAALYYNDPVNLNLEIGSQIDRIKRNGQAAGKRPEVIQSEVDNFTKTAYQAAAQNKAANDPEGFLEGTGGSNLTMMDAVFYQESGGKQLDAKGNPITSPKGAVGIAQVMPDTAKEMAKESGLEWSEERYKTDAQYNAALGKAYMEKQLATFGGNQVLALAAYNAGPRNVNQWIAKNGDPRLGEISMADFVAKIPFKETRDYVTNITNKMNVQGTGYSPYYQLEPVEQVKLRTYAQGLLDKKQSEYRVFLDRRIKDASTAYQNGLDFPDPPTQQDFVNGYGTAKGIYLYQEFNKTREMGSDIALLKDMPYFDQVKYVQARKPVPGTDYAGNYERYQTLVTAFNTMNKQRNDDPVQYAITQGKAQSLDISTPQALEQSISERASQVVKLSNDYNVKLKLFSDNESSALTKLMLKAPTAQKLAYLRAMQQGAKNNRAYNAGLQQISSGAPSLAVAGLIMNKTGKIDGVTASDTAAYILEGNLARTGLKEDGTKVPGIQMPKEKQTRAEFDNYVGNMYAGDPNGASQALETALDYYAGACARKGIIDGSFDSDLFDQAIKATSGEVIDYNDQGNISLPWGMSETEFSDHIAVAWAEQVTGKGIKAGHPSLYGLQNNGDSQYLVKMGTGYLTDPKTGAAVKIDMSPYSLTNILRDLPQ